MARGKDERKGERSDGYTCMKGLFTRTRKYFCIQDESSSRKPTKCLLVLLCLILEERKRILPSMSSMKTRRFRSLLSSGSLHVERRFFLSLSLSLFSFLIPESWREALQAYCRREARTSGTNMANDSCRYLQVPIQTGSSR